MADRDDVFTAGDRVTLLCVGHQGDVVHARLPVRRDAPSEYPALSPGDARAVPRGRSFIVRAGASRILPVAGEWFELTVDRNWRFGGADDLEGAVTRSWIDLGSLELPPLGLRYQGPWTPEGWRDSATLGPDEPEVGDDADAPEPQRREVEIAQVLPDPFTPLELEEDAILESTEWRDRGDLARCEKLLSELLRQDLRCVDAHVHLGNLHLQGYWGTPRPERAQRHYRIGVAIAESALALDGRDVTPRGFIGNRPYLRALHALGLATWAVGDLAGAENLFSRLLWRDPTDGAGARFLLESVRQGIRYEESSL